jgi:hypothetical protein
MMRTAENVCWQVHPYSVMCISKYIYLFIYLFIYLQMEPVYE